MSFSPWQPQPTPPKRSFTRSLLALLLTVAVVGGLTALGLIYGQQVGGPAVRPSPTVVASKPTSTPAATVPQRPPGLGGPQPPAVTPSPTTAIPPSPTVPENTPTPSRTATPVD